MVINRAGLSADLNVCPWTTQNYLDHHMSRLCIERLQHFENKNLSASIKCVKVKLASQNVMLYCSLGCKIKSKELCQF